MAAHSRKLSVSKIPKRKISKIHRKTDFLTWTSPQQEECQSRGGRCWKNLARVSDNVSFGFGIILVAEKQSENWSRGRCYLASFTVAPHAETATSEATAAVAAPTAISAAHPCTDSSESKGRKMCLGP